VVGEVFEGIDVSIPGVKFDRYLQALPMIPKVWVFIAAKFGFLPSTAGEAMRFWHTTLPSSHPAVISKYQNAVRQYNAEQANPDL
jgi:hypothetical protein